MGYNQAVTDVVSIDQRPAPFVIVDEGGHIIAAADGRCAPPPNLNAVEQVTPLPPRR